MGSDLVTVIALGLWQALLPGSLVISSQKRDLTWCYALRSRTSISLKPTLAKPALVCQAVVYVSVADIVTIYHPLLCCCLGQQPKTDKVLQNTDFFNAATSSKMAILLTRSQYVNIAANINSFIRNVAIMEPHVWNHWSSIILPCISLCIWYLRMTPDTMRNSWSVQTSAIFYWQDISLKGFILIKGAEEKSLNYKQCFIKNCCKLQHWEFDQLFCADEERRVQRVCRKTPAGVPCYH